MLQHNVRKFGALFLCLVTALLLFSRMADASNLESPKSLISEPIETGSTTTLKSMIEDNEDEVIYSIEFSAEDLEDPDAVIEVIETPMTTDTED